jgi:hypothetical protein
VNWWTNLLYSSMHSLDRNCLALSYKLQGILELAQADTPLTA